MFFLPVERLVFTVVVALGVIDAALIALKGVSIDLLGCNVLILTGGFSVALGQYYRLQQRDPGIALAATAAGLFVLFTIAGSIFNYMFLPIHFAPIDDLLVRVDAAFGYHWPEVVGLAARYPWVGTAFYWIYATSLPQMAGIILLLGFSRQARMLHHFLLTGVIGALLAIGVWIFFPTFGAKSLYTLPQSVLDAIPLAVDPAYGAELLRLGRDGVEHLSPANVLGLIGFPSFHIIMACMSVCFVTHQRLVFIPLAVLNALMLPAVLVQGGHHLSDVFGGVAVFGLAFWLAGQVVRQLSEPAVPWPRPFIAPAV